MAKTAFILHDSLNGGVATWTRFIFNNIKTEAIIIDNDLIKRDLKKISIKTFFKLLKFISLNDVNRIIVGNSVPALYAKLIRLFKPKIKVIYVSHGWGWSYQKKITKLISYIIEFITIPLVNQLVYVSKEDQRKAKTFIFKRNEKILRNICFKDLQLRKNNNSRPKVLFVGRNAYPKRIDLFIELSNRNKDFDWYIVGSQGENSENLYYLGEIKDFKEYYKYDYFILLSESEGNPLVLHEALSCGLLCMINKLPYHEEFIDNWNSQLLCSDDLNINSLIETFEKLKNKPHPEVESLNVKNKQIEGDFIESIHSIFIK
jgi:glycosyltransferase involved in cell wall biosynthesis